MSHFLVFPYLEPAGRAPAWAARIVRDGNEKKVPTEAFGVCSLASGKA